ncbi:MAG: protease modulator HflC [Burkholderiales bacterium]|nr:protease modulator HflC [Burkholderiales bacterium]
MTRTLPAIAVVLVALIVIASLTLFTVDQRQNAIVFRLGEPVNVIRQPGLYLKVPLLDNVRFFDTRILTMDSDEPERYITSEKKNVLVDSFVKFRIVDVLQYYISVGGDEARAKIRLSQAVNDSLRAEFGKRTIHEVVSGERDRIMELMREKADADARKIGVEVLDVRLKRVDLPLEVSDAVYRRMEAERKRVANELRSLGFAEAEKIRADAERQREIIIAEAYRDAQRIKGEGDARSTAVYAGAFQQNPEFFSFYRSMEAYRQSFKNRADVMVVDPSSDFFKYLKEPSGRK